MTEEGGIMAEEKVKYSEHIPEIKVPEKRKSPRCDSCNVMACWPKEPGDILKGPANCPTKNYPDIIKKAKDFYLKDSFHRKMQLAGARLEGMSSQTPPGGPEKTEKKTGGGE